jgi:hypothetical protein
MHNSDASRREIAEVCVPSLRGAIATKQSSFLVCCIDEWIASLALAMTSETDCIVLFEIRI